MVETVRTVTRRSSARFAALPLAPCRMDDPPAIEDLYDRYATVVFSLALRIVRDRRLAEEILEEVFFRAWQWTQEPNSIRGTIFSWLVEMTRAVAIEAAFDRRPATTSGDQAAPGVEATVLTELPPEQRQVIELAYFEGLTEGEIAMSLGVSQEQVRAWLGEAVETIREANYS
jgi:RNA polymerase sigma-70 factor (ECF subfamily)